VLVDWLFKQYDGFSFADPAFRDVSFVSHFLAEIYPHFALKQPPLFSQSISQKYGYIKLSWFQPGHAENCRCPDDATQFLRSYPFTGHLTNSNNNPKSPAHRHHWWATACAPILLHSIPTSPILQNINLGLSISAATTKFSIFLSFLSFPLPFSPCPLS